MMLFRNSPKIMESTRMEINWVSVIFNATWKHIIQSLMLMFLGT